MSTTTTPATIAETRLEVRIDGPSDLVWQKLTDDIGDWWPDAFYAGGSPGKRSYHVEARPGGRVYESHDDGGGVLWGTVATVQPGKLLQALGATFPNWGGPNFGFITWEVEADGGGTVLRFSESLLGQVSDTACESKEKGWTFLFEVLKAHVEGRPAPEWED